MSNNKNMHPGGAMGAIKSRRKVAHLKRSVIAVKSVLYPNGKYHVSTGLSSNRGGMTS